MTDMAPPNSPQSPDAASVDLCAHGCGYEAVVQHADGRLLCRSCYAAEVGEIAGVNPCPTCGPNEDEPTAATGRREPRTGNAAGLRCTSKPARVWVLPNRSNVTLGWRKALGV